MKFQKDAVRTSVLTLLAVATIVYVLILVGLPGALQKQYTIDAYFDNAGGVQLGAPVLVAGRKVGTVSHIYSPLSDKERPAGHPECEVLISLKINSGNRIYRDAAAVMMQQGLLGSTVIDFVRGNETSGYAEDGTDFIGQRRPDFTEAIPKLLDAIQPVAERAEETLTELKGAAEQLEAMLAKNGPLSTTLGKIGALGDNLTQITGENGTLTLTLKKFGAFAEEISNQQGPLQQTFANLRDFTAQLTEGQKVSKTLDSVTQAARRLDGTLGEVEGMLNTLEPNLDQTVINTRDFTDTLRRQPWRLIWPSTKQYLDENVVPEEPLTPKASSPRTPRGPLK